MRDPGAPLSAPPLQNPPPGERDRVLAREEKERERDGVTEKGEREGGRKRERERESARRCERERPSPDPTVTKLTEVPLLL